jgi:hypothetical protein
VPLIELQLPDGAGGVPGDVRTFLHEAGRRVRRFRREHRCPGFVPCDYTAAYRVLRALAAAEPAPGGLFCEWGSGLGVVTCLAAMLDFDACGIEAHGGLVDAARRLAEDFEVPAEFAHGSFLPAVAGTPAGDFAWLAVGMGDGHRELSLAPEDFSMVFAYPWPDEEGLTADLFECHAALGAVLLTYHAGGDFRLRRKAGPDPPR